MLKNIHQQNIQECENTEQDAGQEQEDIAPCQEEALLSDMPHDEQSLLIASLKAELEAAHKELAHSSLRFEEVQSAFRKINWESQQMRSRLEREKETQLAREKDRLLCALFEPFDNLLRSLEASRSLMPEKLMEGLSMVSAQFQEAFNGLGLELIDPMGQDFDPQFHEALGTKEVQQPEDDGKVLEVWQCGYKTSSSLLRPARVLVGKLSSPTEG